MVSFTAGEFRHRRWTFRRACLGGITLVVALYLIANLSYFTVLSPLQIQGTDKAAATAMSVAYGTGATALVTLLIVVSILGSMNGTALTGPRGLLRNGEGRIILPGIRPPESADAGPLGSRLWCKEYGRRS